MKVKLYAILLFSLLTEFASCSEDDEGIEPHSMYPPHL